jgi:Kef-type K+ transport system membrane component KefB
MLGGILLGPTIMGAAAPVLFGWLFLSSEGATLARDASMKLGMLFFMFLVGLEIDLSCLRASGRRIALIGFIGTLLPIAAGVALVYAVPPGFWGAAAAQHLPAFALFVGMNLANSANPVIARVLMDLGLLTKPIGTLIMSATLVDDLVNWTLFALVMGAMGSSGATPGIAIAAHGALGLLFCAAVLIAGRTVYAAALRTRHAPAERSGGPIAVTALWVLLTASAAEALGLHAFLGAFLAGVALSGSWEAEARARALRPLVVSFFAPLYFVSLGMTTNFVAHFDPVLVAVVVTGACVSKIGSVLLGARAAGMPLNREAWAIGFGLNARGATGLILAGVGLSQGIIDHRVFVALAVMAIATSMMSGPAMRHLLSPRAVPVRRLAAVSGDVG